MKRLAAALSLDKHMMSEALRKSLRLARRRKLAAWCQNTFSGQLPARLSLSTLQPGRVVSPHSSEGSIGASVLRNQEFAQARPRFGYQRVADVAAQHGMFYFSGELKVASALAKSCLETGATPRS